MSEFLSRGVDFEVTRIGEWHENLSEKTGDGATKLFLVGVIDIHVSHSKTKFSLSHHVNTQ